MKKTSILRKAFFVMLCVLSGFIGWAQTTYTFSNYPQGTQYAVNEEHVLDNSVTLYTTECHFTSQLRVYSSSSHNGFFQTNALPYYIESLSFNMGNNIDSIAIDGSTDGSTWSRVGTINVTESTYNNYTINFGNQDYNFFKFDVIGSKQIRVTSMTINYKSTGPGLTTQMPSFSHPAGVFTEPTAISLTCSTPGSTIYYTLDGTTPSNSSTLYTTPIQLTQTTTIKAIAYSNGYAPSSVVSNTYYFPITVSNLAAFKAQSASPQPYTIGNDVTFVYKNGSYTYVKDNSAALLIYGNNVTTSYTEGDQISGLMGTNTVFNQQIEMSVTADPGAATGNTGAVAPISTTIADIISNYSQYDAQLVTIHNVTLDEELSYEAGTQGSTTDISQGSDIITIYNRFKLMDTTMVAGTVTDITGFVAIYGTTIQIYPRDNADLIPSAPQPSLSILAPAAGSTFSTLDTLPVNLNIQNFVLGTDGLLKIESSILPLVNLPNPSYLDAAAWAAFQNMVLSPLPAGSFTATVSLVDMNQQALSTPVSATTNFTVVAPILATPVISFSGNNPTDAADTYYFNADVTISAEPGSTVHYTTDGTTPSEASATYTAPFTVNTTTTVKAMATMANYANSEVATKTVTIETPTVAAPVIAPTAGTYADSVTITLTCTTPGASIYYTTDNTEPTTASNLYSTPFVLTANTTVKAKAFKADWYASPMATANYTIAHEAAMAVTPSALNFSSTTLTGSFDVTSAFLTAPITLTCDNAHFTLSQNSIPATTTAATITVTFDGTEAATGLVTLTSDTLSAQVALTATALLPTPTITPVANDPDTSFTVTVACSVPTASIYYTLDGTTPDETATLYTAPFTLNTPGAYTVKAIAIQNGWENSAVATANYTVIAPFIPSTIADTLAYYTGFEPTEGFTLGTQYNNIDEALNGPASQQWGIVYGAASTTSPICDTASMQMRWYAANPTNIGYARTNFDVTHATRIQFKAKSTNGLNAIVSYSTDGGNTYVDSLFELTTMARTYELVVSETAEYDNVRFKFSIALPETAPTATSRLYIDSVNIFNFPSLISGTVDMPTITPNSAFVYETTQVSISCPTADAAIYYTTDGTTPDESSNLYSAPFDVTATTTVKAIAFKTGMNPSNIATVTYTFPTEVANIASFVAANSETNNTIYKIAGDVTFVYRNGRNMYVQDATGGLLIYDRDTVITNNYTEGDIISGGIYGTYTLYNGLSELVATHNVAAASGNNGPVVPVVATVSDIVSNYAQYESRLVKLEGVTFVDGGTFSTAAATNLNIEQDDNGMQVRNNFKTLDMTIPANYDADVIGFVLVYSTSSATNYQIAPRDNNDIIGLVQETVETPVITVEPLTNNMYAVEITCATEDAVIYYTIDGTTPDENANLYTGTFTAEGGNTIKAIATKEGWSNSEVAVYENVYINDYADANISVYPNPTNGELNITNKELTIENVGVYDVFGKLLETMNGDVQSVNMSSYPSGTYFLRISTDNGMIVKKVVRQ